MEDEVEEYFSKLGDAVEAEWRGLDYDEEAFPALARRALEESDPASHIDPWQIVDWAQRESPLPRQQDVEGRFGNPPLTLYAGPRFHIDVYFWLDGTTSIHQHSFAGAFHVLLGSSIHSTYRFDVARNVNPHFRLGALTLQHVELLARGETRLILPGEEFIHSLFHLDRPSATITIRTYQSPEHLPQFDYVKPAVALDPFHREATAIKRLQTAGLLLAARHPDAHRRIAALVAREDLQTTFQILEIAFRHLSGSLLQRAFDVGAGRQQFELLLRAARERHGEAVDLIAPCFAEMERQRDLIERRSVSTEREQRFLLALLLNVTDKELLIDTVRSAFPERHAEDTLADWVIDLSQTKQLGSSSPNLLGIETFDEDRLAVLEVALRSKKRLLADGLRRMQNDRGMSENTLSRILDEFRSSRILNSLLAID